MIELEKVGGADEWAFTHYLFLYVRGQFDQSHQLIALDIAPLLSFNRNINIGYSSVNTKFRINFILMANPPNMMPQNDLNGK